MKKALAITSVAVVLAPAAVVAGYFGLQAYLDWLIAGAKRPLTGVTRPPGPDSRTAPPGLDLQGPGD